LRLKGVKKTAQIMIPDEQKMKDETDDDMSAYLYIIA
jgi:hypothetical protein